MRRVGSGGFGKFFGIFGVTAGLTPGCGRTTHGEVNSSEAPSFRRLRGVLLRSSLTRGVIGRFRGPGGGDVIPTVLT